MNEDLKVIYASVAGRRGWDFSRLRDVRDPVPWEYEEVVQHYLDPASHVLDLGTGGGERFLTLAPSFGTGVGTDIDPDMIRVAQGNQPASLLRKVSFMVMAAGDLAFPAASFDVVLARQAPISVLEVMRVLKPGGFFVTQQVGGRNTQNIFETFGWVSNGAYWESYWREHDLPSLNLTSLREAFGNEGGHVVAWGEYDVGYAFLDVESLIFWLKAVPLPESFDIERHEDQLRSFIERHRTAKGIATNEHRELLIVQKD